MDKSADTVLKNRIRILLIHDYSILSQKNIYFGIFFHLVTLKIENKNNNLAKTVF